MNEYTQGIARSGPVILCNGLTVTVEHIVARLNENEKLSDQMNELSDALLGYREGIFLEILNRAIHLRMKAENVEIDNQFRGIADKIDELKLLVDDIKSDA